MDRTVLLGAGCTIVGVTGYLVGLTQPYVGRELSLIAVLVGITLVAVGGGLP